MLRGDATELQSMNRTRSTPDTASNESRTRVPNREMVGISWMPGVEVGVPVTAGVPVRVGVTVTVAAGVVVVVGAGSGVLVGVAGIGVAVIVAVGVGGGGVKVGVGGTGVSVGVCPSTLIEPAIRKTATNTRISTSLFRHMIERTLLSIKNSRSIPLYAPRKMGYTAWLGILTTKSQKH